MSEALYWEVSGFTSLGCSGAKAGMQVWYGNVLVGSVEEAEGDFVRVNFTTDSRTIHRELVIGVDRQTLNPHVQKGHVLLDRLPAQAATLAR